jgi:hypothetical protein
MNDISQLHATVHLPLETNEEEQVVWPNANVPVLYLTEDRF